MACIHGARAVQEGVIKAEPRADIEIAIVWVDVMPLDGARSARRTAQILSADPRVHHFHDPEQRVGRALSKSLKWEDKAWDIYVLYPKGVQWSGDLPKPQAYVHQLSQRSGDGHYCTGEDLTVRLRKLVGEATSKK